MHICYINELTSLPTLPQTLISLYCSHNKLTSLPTLPQNLQNLYCYGNELTSLPILPQNLQILNCSNNKLTSLPIPPQNLISLDCYDNELTFLPTLPQNLQELQCFGNPVYEIVDSNSLFQIKQNIQILNNFRDLFYCLKYKKQLRKLLWENVREPIIKIKYHPNYLVENLKDNDDIDIFLNNWK